MWRGSDATDFGDPATPDHPIGFGYKCAWLALKTTHTTAIVAALELRKVCSANWRQGIDAAYTLNERVFVAGPVDGWTFVVGLDASRLLYSEDGGDRLREWIERLSGEFDEACYFVTHRGVDYHAWVRAVDGKVVRGFVYSPDFDDARGVGWAMGDLSDDERTLDINLVGLDRDDHRRPDEDDVIRMAEVWTINPLLLDDRDLPMSAGVVGEWRPPTG